MVGRVRLSSELDGPWNFQVGLFYMDSDDNTNYYVVTSELDYWAQVTAPFTPFLNSAPPYYINATPSASLKSSAAFGEVYWDADREDEVDAGRALHARREGRQGSADALFGAGRHAADRDGVQRFPRRRDHVQRVHRPLRLRLQTGWFDDSTLYAFYSRGYKAGGFNPPLDRSLPQFAGTPEVYDPEFVNAFEVGSKNVLAGGRVQANLTAFYYKYDALQVSKIVARTSVNENVDADIYGLEGEFVLSPVNDLLIDANFAYLKTKIKDFSSIDPRDPSNGDPNWTVIKDITDGSNCVLATAALGTAQTFGLVLPVAAVGGPFGFCGAMAQNGLPVQDGVAANLDGNSLQGTPEWSFKVGAQYTFHLGSSLNLTTRADYYWRDSFYARIFNRPIDKIDAWDVVNAQVELASSSNSWFLRGYVYNVLDDDNITGMYVTDASSGLFTNVFALDPRTYGLVLGFRF